MMTLGVVASAYTDAIPDLVQILGTYGDTVPDNTSVINLPEDIPNGGWVLLTMHHGSTTSGMACASTRELMSPTNLGSRRAGVYGFIKSSGQASISVTLPVGVYYSLMWGIGSAPVNEWVAGTPEVRSAYGSSPRNWARCPSANSTKNQSLAIAIAFEATNAVEDPDSILSVDNGFTEVFYRKQGPVAVANIETVWLGEKVVPIGPTGLTTILYRNAQDLNALGLHIIIPPA